MLSKNNVASFFSSTALRKLFFLITTPVYIYFLLPTEYGIFSLCTGFSILLAGIMGCGIRNVVSIEYFQRDSDARLQLIAQAFLIVTLLAGVLGFILLSNNSAVSYYFFGNAASCKLIMLCWIYAYLQTVVDLTMQILICSQQSMRSIVLQSLGSLSTLIIAVSLLLAGYKTEGVLVANIIGLALFCVAVLLVYIKSIARISLYTLWNKEELKSHIALGLPFVPLLLSGWLMAATTRTLLAWNGMFDAVGLYAITELVAVVCHAFILSPCVEIYYPQLFQQFAQFPDKQNLIDGHHKRRMIRAALVALVLSVPNYFLWKPVAVYLLPVAYHAALPYLWLMGISQLGAFVATGMLCYIQYRKQTWFSVAAFASAVVCNMIVSYYLIPLYGLMGGMVALIIAYSWYAALAWRYNCWLHRHTYQASLVVDVIESPVNY